MSLGQAEGHTCGRKVNPLTHRAAKKGLTVLEIFNLETHFLESI